MGQYCNELEYNQELTDTAQQIADNIHKEGHLEGCQPLTIVGVALFMLNSRIADGHAFIQFKKTD